MVSLLVGAVDTTGGPIWHILLAYVLPAILLIGGNFAIKRIERRDNQLAQKQTEIHTRDDLELQNRKFEQQLRTELRTAEREAREEADRANHRADVYATALRAHRIPVPEVS